MTNIDRILVALRSNAPRTNTLDIAIELADALQSELDVVHVRSLRDYPADLDDKDWETLESHTSKKLANWVNAKLHIAEISTNLAMLKGDTTIEIAQYVHSIGIETTIVGVNYSQSLKFHNEAKLLEAIGEQKTPSIPRLIIVPEQFLHN